jgi:hypothetical protein
MKTTMDICFHLQSRISAIDFTRDPLVGLQFLQVDCKVTNWTSLYYESMSICYLFLISIYSKIILETVNTHTRTRSIP